MRMLCIFILSIGCLAWAGDRRADKHHLVIMSFNAEFMWDGVEPEEGQVKFERKGDRAAAQAHMREIAAIIRRANPDLVNLVEVENLDALETLRQEFLADMGYRAYLIEGGDTFTGQDVGLLTRIDPVEPLAREDREGCSGEVGKSVSKNYQAKFQLGELRLALVGLHLLAVPLDEQRKDQRQAQADAIHQTTLDLAAAGYDIVVLGDFNDFDGKILDHDDNTPVSNVLAKIASMSDSASDDLINAASHVPKAERFTSFYDRNKNGQVDGPQELSSIDHILLSPALDRLVASVRLDQQHDLAVVSDHFPVIVTLDLPKSAIGTASQGGLVIDALLPDPEGEDAQHEFVRVQNTSSQPVSLEGWRLRNGKGQERALDTYKTLAPGKQLDVVSEGRKLALKNDGDTISLIDPKGRVVDQVSYRRAREGQLLQY